MRKARFIKHQNIAVMNSVKAGICEASYYNGKAKCGGMEAPDINKMKDLKMKSGDLNKCVPTCVWKIVN